MQGNNCYIVKACALFINPDFTPMHIYTFIKRMTSFLKEVMNSEIFHYLE